MIIGSTVLQMEIDNIKDTLKHEKVMALYGVATECVSYTQAILQRAQKLATLATIHRMDALHIASAETGGADIFITTDDKLLRACAGLALSVRVMNPVKCLAEVM